MFLRPNTLREATEALAEGGRVLAGGTDIFPALGVLPVRDKLIDITRVRELREIELASDQIRIGGAVTWSEIAAASLPRCFDALRAAAREIGGVQVQNRGTIAGNLCNASPAADSVPCLLILDAEVELTSASGVRRLPLEKFIVGNRKTSRRPDEIVSSVIVPVTVADAPSVFLKLGARRYLVISISMVAAVLSEDGNGRIGDARVAVGSCSAVAQRLPELERSLAGRPRRRGLGSVACAAHLASLSPIDDVRASAAYRVDATLTLIRRALDQCVEARQ